MIALAIKMHGIGKIFTHFVARAPGLSIKYVRAVYSPKNGSRSDENDVLDWETKIRNPPWTGKKKGDVRHKQKRFTLQMIALAIKMHGIGKISLIL